MKATKKIVGAACALVAAVALSAGSTFAWFSTNGKVTATGMKVTAVVPTDLSIEQGLVYDITLINQATVDFGDSANTKTLSPAKLTEETSKEHVKIQVPDTWTTKPTGATPGKAATYKDIVDESDGSTDTAATHYLTTLTTTTDGVSEKYVYVKAMSLVNKGEEGKTLALTANVKVTWTNDDTSHEFLNCAFIVSQNDAAPSPASAYEDMYQPTTSGLTPATGAKTASWDVDVMTMDNNKAYQVLFVVYFDGDNQKCFTNNAQSVDGLNIEITYQQKVVVAGP